MTEPHHNPSSTPPPVTDADVEAALNARVPGGAQVWWWLPTEKGGQEPHQTARNVMRCALEAVAARSNQEAMPYQAGDGDAEVVDAILRDYESGAMDAAGTIESLVNLLDALSHASSCGGI